jgi:hypothetical protein
MARNQGSFGAVLFIGLVLVGFVIAREFFGFDPMPLLRGMHLDVPLVGLLIGAALIVLWAGKFLDFQ